MFKPHVTVACVVHAKDKFLIVEETINGKALWNQPAGHLEADETLVQAAERELWEEDRHSRHATAFYPHASVDCAGQYAVFTLPVRHRLNDTCATQPHDSDIDRCLWLSAQEILTASNLRSQLVAESIRSYQQDPRYPLSLIGAFNWPLLGGA